MVNGMELKTWGKLFQPMLDSGPWSIEIDGHDGSFMIVYDDGECQAKCFHVSMDDLEALVAVHNMYKAARDNEQT